jgi:acetyl-CoA carboxylase biotin carboxyl carrier protein
MTIDFKELSELLAAIAANNITELTLKNADFELTVSQGSSIVMRESISTATTISELNSPLIATSTPEPSQVAVDRITPTTIDKKWVEIKSPMVGTFYRSPAPDEAAFASTGDRIRVGQTVCIIEAMKLMNEIEAESAGQVMEVLVENGQPIEFGQTLMYINPG